MRGSDSKQILYIKNVLSSFTNGIGFYEIRHGDHTDELHGNHFVTTISKRESPPGTAVELELATAFNQSGN